MPKATIKMIKIITVIIIMTYTSISGSPTVEIQSQKLRFKMFLILYQIHDYGFLRLILALN